MSFHVFPDPFSQSTTSLPDGISKAHSLDAAVAADPLAMTAFSALSAQQKQKLVGYILDAPDSRAEKERIRNAVSMLNRTSSASPLL